MSIKSILSITLSCLLGGIVSADEAQKAARLTTPHVRPRDPQAGLVQSDPRHLDRGVVLRFTRGAKPADSDHGAYVIIAWARPPAGSNLRGYQFWGDDRIIEQKAIELVLEAVLKERPRDVFVLGNDWAAGSELDPLLQKLSKRHQIDVFGGSTFAFDKVDFQGEPMEVRNLISMIINQTQKTQPVAPSDGSKPSN